ncbi:MAG: hypothetical protein A4S09_13060 [Proteobacteria bacterium SG_bin7]|nr:MAG: hypothetical protein A4S09_13060 [Proteobacteria bacterium SG_bin7]
MNTLNYLIGLFLLTGVSSAQARLDVHEWGTFTSLVGSNGKTQHGMYHEDEKLPDFVHNFGEILSPRQSNFLGRSGDCDPRRDKGCIPERMITNSFVSQKMETPVVYFYSDRQQPVTINVRFPNGAVTQSYPAPVSTSPTPNDEKLINGNTTYQIEVLDSKNAKLPEVDPTNIYSHARNVQSNFVRAGSEIEKFIFYRGLGHYQPRLNIHSIGLDLAFLADKGFEPQITFLVDVNSQGHAQMIRVRGIGHNKEVTVSGEIIRQLKNHDLRENKHVMNGEQMNATLLQALIGAGLYQDEAQAMLDTWSHGYFKTPGLRVLYILSRSEVEQVLPLTVSPRPDNLNRAFIGRIEVLRQDEELRILKDIESQCENFKVESLGRFAEPILRRVYEVYKEVATAGGGTHIPGKTDKLFVDLIAKAAAM